MTQLVEFLLPLDAVGESAHTIRATLKEGLSLDQKEVNEVMTLCRGGTQAVKLRVTPLQFVKYLITRNYKDLSTHVGFLEARIVASGTPLDIIANMAKEEPRD